MAATAIIETFSAFRTYYVQHKRCVTICLVILSQLIWASTITAAGSSPISSHDTYPHQLSVQELEISFQSGNYLLYGKIYYPTNISGPVPGILFCEGLAGYLEAYDWLPKALAAQGYIVLLYDPPGQGRSEGLFPFKGIYISAFNLFFRFGVSLEGFIHYARHELVTSAEDALTYLLDNSLLSTMVNKTSIGLIGHSLGGIVSTETAAHNQRIKAMVALSHANPLSINNITIPIQFQAGGYDIPFFSVPILLRCYHKASAPKELIVIEHGTHIGFTTAGAPLTPNPSWQKDLCLRYALGWFDFFLKRDQNAYLTITTPSDHLSPYIKSRYNFDNNEFFL